jgi:deoxyribose-phosphate aldolase
VWPRLARLAGELAPAGVRVAAVANFPAGDVDIGAALRDVAQIRAAGAQEVDVVLPWRALLAGDHAIGAKLLAAVRRESVGLTLKVILESGELGSDAAIATASRIALEAGADFIKTSTGKTARGASPRAARLMLEAIAACGRAAGFKASGGVRSVADAEVYLDLQRTLLGAEALTPQRFRIGASGLLDAIEASLGAGTAAPSTKPGSY